MDVESIIGLLIKAAKHNDTHIRLSDKKMLFKLSPRITRGFTAHQQTIASSLISKYSQYFIDKNIDITNTSFSKTIDRVIKMKLQLHEHKIHIEFIKDFALTKVGRAVVGDLLSKINMINYDYANSKMVCYANARNLKKILAVAESNSVHFTEMLIQDEIIALRDKIEEFAPPILSYSEGEFNLSGSPFLQKKFKELADTSNVFNVITTARKMLINIDDSVLNLVKSEHYATRRISQSKVQFLTLSPDNPDTKLEDLATALVNLNHLPVLVVVSENDALTVVKSLADQFLKDGVDRSKINVFFRLPQEHPDCNEFKEYVKENKLNSFIDTTTKVVFISDKRLPKRLVTSGFVHAAAIFATTHDFSIAGSYAVNTQLIIGYRNSIVNSFTVLRKQRGIMSESL